MCTCSKSWRRRRGSSTYPPSRTASLTRSLAPANPYNSPSLCELGLQGLSLHVKADCDVGRVEFAKGWRLTLQEIQPLSFTVPRRHTDKFQNDIFPKAIAKWKPAVDAKTWYVVCTRSDLGQGREGQYSVLSMLRALKGNLELKLRSLETVNPISETSLFGVRDKSQATNPGSEARPRAPSSRASSRPAWTSSTRRRRPRPRRRPPSRPPTPPRPPSGPPPPPSPPPPSRT